MLVWTCAMVHAETPQDTFAQIVAALIPPGDVGSMWKDLDAVEQIRWQPLPPTMLSTPLPGGAMFSRDGVATIAGRRVAVKAAGTRSTVTNVYFRNQGEAIGEDTVLAALTHRGLALQPARARFARPGGERQVVDHQGDGELTELVLFPNELQRREVRSLRAVLRRPAADDPGGAQAVHGS